jgi:hypothetical protein
MSDLDRIRDLARRNFEECRMRKRAELAAAKDTAEVAAIEDNYEAALKAYLVTIDDSFAATQGMWDDLIREATDAKDELDQALRDAKGLAETVKAATKLTGSITKLVKAVRAA